MYCMLQQQRPIITSRWLVHVCVCTRKSPAFAVIVGLCAVPAVYHSISQEGSGKRINEPNEGCSASHCCVFAWLQHLLIDVRLLAGWLAKPARGARMHHDKDFAESGD